MHDCTHQLNMGEQGINTVPACIKSIPHSSLLDDYSSCIIGTHGETMEAVHQRDDQNTSAINVKGQYMLGVTSQGVVAQYLIL